jgi:hypothetical protein
VGLQNIQEVLFIDKTNVLLGHVGALDRRPMCARAHVTAQKSHGAAGEVMARATQKMRVDEACTRSHLWARAYFQGFSLLNSPFKLQFDCKDLQHHKILKLNETLDINKTKSLMNIN